VRGLGRKKAQETQKKESDIFEAVQKTLFPRWLVSRQKKCFAASKLSVELEKNP
jgi:hypothetical protein|tara:strand:+ start:120 stop:281 length:162 start_codon:yes stop_codon:yes gene_type:complete